MISSDIAVILHVPLYSVLKKMEKKFRKKNIIFVELLNFLFFPVWKSSVDFFSNFLRQIKKYSHAIFFFFYFCIALYVPHEIIPTLVNQF